MDELRAWFEAATASGRAAQPSATSFPLAATLAAELSIPGAVAEARAFYAEACFDWGGASVHRQRIGSREVFFVHVGTDGDSGWLEVFDDTGAFLLAASLDGTRLVWEPRDVARARIESGEPPL
jgi:hypothetical protein